MIQWLDSILPCPSGFEWIQYQIAGLLVVAMVVIIITMFCNIFNAIFRR